MKRQTRQCLFIVTFLIFSVSVLAIPTGYSSPAKYGSATVISFHKQVGDSVWSTSAAGMAVEESRVSVDYDASRVAESQTPIPTDRLPIAEKEAPSETTKEQVCRPGTTTCGVGACKKTVQDCVDGVPQRCVPGKAIPEVCGNSIDDNCNGETDEDCKACTPNWVYSQWGPCSSGVQLRKAHDSNNCMTGAPTDLTQPCSSLCNSVMQQCFVGVGACVRFGTQTRSCVNGILGNLSACSAVPGTPIAEICGNVLDDNCNGQSDENCPPACTPQSQLCALGIGACMRLGNQTRSCVNGTLSALFGLCSATPGTPVPEICGNNIDDDCNGQYEDGCVNQPNGNACASGSGCQSQNCVSNVCAPYQDCVNACTTTVQNCYSYSCGWFGQSTCQSCNPYQTTNPACVQACVPACTPVPVQCSVGVGRCANTGIQIRHCVNGVLGAPGPCSATPGTPIPEMCGNNIDDNCNGQTDEGCPPPPCTPGTISCGLGVCLHTVQSCINGVPQGCTPGQAYSVQDVCGNNIDDNCNGQTDEGCLNQNGQSCYSWSQCYSQSCSNGICTSHQDCINACTTTVQNCYSYSCGFAGWSTCQQCNPYQTTDPACAMSCH
ncbi:hypothetical protein J4219_08225 [Candidatus Woesearchaeota archaeon]|nr:hypothetical protein [Candidatus Woesearchaeota archaeon]